MPINGSRPRYTLREALGEPGVKIKTMMSAFYCYLTNWILCESGRTVIYQIAEALPTGWELSYAIYDAGRQRKHPFLRTLKPWLPLVLLE